MLRRTREMRGDRLSARDGEIGRLKDFYFDDHTWTVRYLVADTGTWLPHRKVLLSPFAVAGFHNTPHPAMELNLTRAQIEGSPSIETHRPVSRQFEAQYMEYFGWPYYWPGPLLWGPVALPAFDPGTAPTAPRQPETKSEDSHLRSVEEVLGYNIQALDNEFGHVEDFVIDDTNWAIRYLVVDTRNWWPGKRVLLAPQWVSSFSWTELRVYIDLDRETVRRAPEYSPAQPITRDYEKALFDHYSQKPYWEA